MEKYRTQSAETEEEVQAAILNRNSQLYESLHRYAGTDQCDTWFIVKFNMLLPSVKS